MKWPAFTSNLVFEVFRPSALPRRSFASYLLSFLHLAPLPTDDTYVRLRYNSRAVKIPACAAPQNHRPGSEGELCTWKAFDEAVSKVAMSAEEWDGICAGGPVKSSKREG